MPKKESNIGLQDLDHVKLPVDFETACMIDDLKVMRSSECTCLSTTMLSMFLLLYTFPDGSMSIYLEPLGLVKLSFCRPGVGGSATSPGVMGTNTSLDATLYVNCHRAPLNNMNIKLMSIKLMLI